MYSDSPYNGSGLPDKSLCLTFDDGPGKTVRPGPGPRTVEIAQYLSDQSVPATFFMVGKFASDLPEIMPQVESLGHLIGNHTYDHPDLVHYQANGGDPVYQVARADGLIRNWIDSPVAYFRPPYGSWNASVAAVLNANLTVSLSHVGPINWDIDAGDWSHWLSGADPQACSTAYLQAIEAQRHGIVLMHDCTADRGVGRLANRGLEMLMILIPKLKQRGYTFVRLDSVPGIPGEDQSTITIALRGINRLYVSPQLPGGGPITVNGAAMGPWERLVIEDRYVGKVALRTANGQYVSPQGGGGGSVFANGTVVGPWESFDLISLGDNRVAFRTVTGHFLMCNTGAGSMLDATPWTLNSESIFTFEYFL
jgi:peptidoglycan/xylan/chitin deacetylase (PgdA/CDA1 family)